jgi:hypothetical protein
MLYFNDANMSPANFSNCLSIHYQNFRGLRTKEFQFYDNVCSSDFDINFLPETRLIDLWYDHNLLPSTYNFYLCDWLYNSKARDDGVLTVISTRLGSCKRRYDLLLYSEYVWVEIPKHDGIWLIGNHYFSPETKPEAIQKCLPS